MSTGCFVSAQAQTHTDFKASFSLALRVSASLYQAQHAGLPSALLSAGIKASN
jgi:hypothetical protein